MKIKYPIIRYLGKTLDLWEVCEPYECSTSKGIVLIGDGFRTDGASIPRLPFTRWVIGEPMEGEYLPAALVHDALYSSEMYRRDICDRIFFELLKRCGIGMVKRNAMYYAVRIFGGAVWRSHTKQSVEKSRLFVRIK